MNTKDLFNDSINLQNSITQRFNSTNEVKSVEDNIITDMPKLFTSILGIMTEPVISTHGANGSNVLLTNAEHGYYSKDGKSVLNAINSNNPAIERLIALLKEAANEVERDSGDGTTTFTILINKLMQVGIMMRDAGFRRNHIEAFFDYMQNSLLHRVIDKHSFELTEDNLKDILKLSGNHNSSIFKLTNEFYEISKEFISNGIDYTFTFTEFINGVEDRIQVIRDSYILPSGNKEIAINNSDNNTTFRAEDIDVYMLNTFGNTLSITGIINMIITREQDKDNVSEDNGFKKLIKPVIIFVDGVTTEHRNLINVNILPLTKPLGGSREASDYAEDLVNTVFMNPTKEDIEFTGNQNMTLISGTIKSILVSSTKTLMKMYSNTNTSRIVENINDLLDKEVDTNLRSKYKNRLTYLRSNYVNIIISGDSLQDITNRKDLLHDVCTSMYHLIKNPRGVIGGGRVYQLMEYYLQKDLKDLTVIKNNKILLDVLNHKDIELFVGIIATAPLTSIIGSAAMESDQINILDDIRNDTSYMNIFNSATSEIENFRDQNIFDSVHTAKLSFDVAAKYAKRYLSISHAIKVAIPRF